MSSFLSYYSTGRLELELFCVFSNVKPEGNRSVLYLFIQFPVFSLHSLRNIFYYNIGKLVFKASSLLSKNMKKEIKKNRIEKTPGREESRKNRISGKDRNKRNYGKDRPETTGTVLCEA